MDDILPVAARIALGAAGDGASRSLLLELLYADDAAGASGEPARFSPERLRQLLATASGGADGSDGANGWEADGALLDVLLASPGVRDVAAREVAAFREESRGQSPGPPPPTETQTPALPPAAERMAFSPGALDRMGNL